jgi:hypothetical protein
MKIMLIHHWFYMRFFIYGASYADDVYGLIDSFDKSPLHMLTTKDGIKVIEKVLKMNNIIPSDVIMKTRSQKGGKYQYHVIRLSFHLIMPSHTISFIGGNSSKYMKTGIANNGRTKKEITDDKSRGGKNSSTYMTTNIANNGRTKEDITDDKSRGGKEGGKNSSTYMTTNVTKGGRTKKDVTPIRVRVQKRVAVRPLAARTSIVL